MKGDANDDPSQPLFDQDKLKHLHAIIRLGKEGWLGCMPDGKLVDRRLHPEAIPVQENSLMGIGKPQKL